MPVALAAALAIRGIGAGLAGHAAADLLAAVEARGLAASVEEIAGVDAYSVRQNRYRARVWRSEVLARRGPWAVGHLVSTGRGRTEVEALHASPRHP